LTQRSRLFGAVALLLLLGMVLSACGAAPVAENWPGLTVDVDTVYAISGTPQQVYILDAETLGPRATFPPPTEVKGVPYWSPVAVGGDLAFVGFGVPGAGNAALYAFDPETGQQQWNVPVVSIIMAQPTYVDGAVYVGNSEGQVYAVDVESKRIKPGWPFQASSAIWASPVVEGGRVYVASMDHNLYSLDAESGELIWEQKLGGALAESPAVANDLSLEDGILYIGGFDGRVHAVKADTGEIVEGFDFLAENWVRSVPLMVDGQLFVTSLDGRLYALDPASGAVIEPYPYNSSEIDNKNEVLRASPVEADEFIIVATQSGRVIAVRADNAQRGCYWPSGTPQTEILTTPVVSGNLIYVLLMNGQVHTLDREALDSGTCAKGPSFSPPEND
jgi:outer membrane protein assembly factor BamB